MKETARIRRAPTTETMSKWQCTAGLCFLCAMKESNPCKRMAAFSKYFKEVAHNDDPDLVLVLSSLWSIAMKQPDDPEFPMLGIFHSMSQLIERGLNDKEWLHSGQNVYIPYYAAHIIGSYTMNMEEFAEEAVRAGVIPPLVELMKGSLSWVEQRVAVRALGHLASYGKTFESVGSEDEEVEKIVRLAMEVASRCVDVVYVEFIMKERRLSYQSDLLTRGLGDEGIENSKAEEWASQMQCWSLHLLNCFASKERGLGLILQDEFLRDICGMWGGITSENSSAGIGLMRILCYNALGRNRIAGCREVLSALCNLSRSSGDWQYMAIDCLLLLIQDPHVKVKVIDAVIEVLADLVELKTLGHRQQVGEAITNALLKEKGNTALSPTAQRLIQWIHTATLQRSKEKTLAAAELQARRALSSARKLQGNAKFTTGDYHGAVLKYTEALEVCPLIMRKDKVVLYSNRAQCHLMLGEAIAAVRDTTRALCLSSPVNSHAKSLWRRSQAYDMLGCCKESLTDCMMYVNGGPASKDGKNVRVPHYAARMISKQMNATWIFYRAKKRYPNTSKSGDDLHGNSFSP
ncbi:Tetratricopeptide repeat protein 1 [Nymphaea thermarum]|nr:Tetratricopeptide repeat protein 1 [Nymphaea thermarum]